MSKFRGSVFAIFVAVYLFCPTRAAAVLATGVSAGTSNLSLKVAAGAVTAGAGVAGAGVAKENNVAVIGGLFLGLGGLGLGVVDPPGGAFFDGSFTIHYPSDVISIMNMGWLGPWGADPGLPPLPVDPNQWAGLPDRSFVALQSPNAALTEVIANGPGVATISFDWGNTPLEVQTPGPSNFYAFLFQARQNVVIQNLGDFAAAPDQANLYVSTPGYRCIPPDETEIRRCGEPTTSYFRLVAVSEPPSGLLMLSLAMIGIFLQRFRH